jgi:hypothetical protein
VVGHNASNKPSAGQGIQHNSPEEEQRQCRNLRECEGEDTQRVVVEELRKTQPSAKPGTGTGEQRAATENWWHQTQPNNVQRNENGNPGTGENRATNELV